MDEREDIRPYFIPGDINYEALPPEVRLALRAKIEPMYKELVLGATSHMEASAGMSLVFLACLEVLEQYQLARDEFKGLADGGSDPGERQIRREPYYRLHSAKSKTMSAMLRMSERRKVVAQPPQSTPQPTLSPPGEVDESH